MAITTVYIKSSASHNQQMLEYVDREQQGPEQQQRSMPGRPPARRQQCPPAPLPPACHCSGCTAVVHTPAASRNVPNISNKRCLHDQHVLCTCMVSCGSPPRRNPAGCCGRGLGAAACLAAWPLVAALRPRSAACGASAAACRLRCVVAI